MSRKSASSSPQKSQPRLNSKSKPEPSRQMSTGTGGKNTPPKPKGDGRNIEGRLTRAKVVEEEKKQVEKDREAALNMPLEEKRKRYKCGPKRYTTLAEVPTWKEYAKEETVAATSPKKKKSSGRKYEAIDELNKKVSVWRGDITTLEIDAIVNAANESLMGGGGVDGAIHSAAGMKLKNECFQLKGCKTGDAKITSGYDLPAKYVIHTVGPIGQGEKDLHSCYTRCLEVMRENDLTSIAFPCISTGIYGYPNEKAATLAMKTVREWLENEEYGAKVERVIFCLFLKVDVDLYNEGMKKFFPLVEDSTDENGDKNGKPNESSETKAVTQEDRKESNMDVDTDEKKEKDVKVCKTKADNSDTDKQNSDNDVEMKDISGNKDATAKAADKMEEELEKTEKESDSSEVDKGGNPDSNKGDDLPDDEKGDKTVSDTEDNVENKKGDTKTEGKLADTPSENAKGKNESRKDSSETKENKETSKGKAATSNL